MAPTTALPSAPSVPDGVLDEIAETETTIADLSTVVVIPSRKTPDRLPIGTFHGRPVHATLHALGSAATRYSDVIRPASIPAACHWLAALFATADCPPGRFEALKSDVRFGEISTTYALTPYKGAISVRVVLRRETDSWLVLTVLPREGNAK